jgi:transcriptional regulator with XRE-family HTH domain
MTKGKVASDKQFQPDYQRRHKGLAIALRLARKEAGLSQAEAAFMISSNQSFLSRVERTGEIDSVVLERLAAVYNKPVSAFKSLDFEAVTRRNLNQPDIPQYEGRTRAEWKYFIENRRWPPEQFKSTHNVGLGAPRPGKGHGPDY